MKLVNLHFELAKSLFEKIVVQFFKFGMSKCFCSIFSIVEAFDFNGYLMLKAELSFVSFSFSSQFASGFLVL